jgi:hypothetical protein
MGIPLENLRVKLAVVALTTLLGFAVATEEFLRI